MELGSPLVLERELCRPLAGLVNRGLEQGIGWRRKKKTPVRAEAVTLT